MLKYQFKHIHGQDMASLLSHFQDNDTQLSLIPLLLRQPFHNQTYP